MMSILQMNIYGSIIIVLTVIIRAVAINKLPKRTFLILWLIAIARLTIPFTLPSLINVYPAVSALSEISGEVWIIPDYTQLNAPSPSVTSAEVTPIQPAVPSQEPDPASQLPVTQIIWSIGAILFATVFIAPHLRSYSRYRCALPCESEAVTIWQRSHTLRRKYKILMSDEIISPFTYGILRPVIILPDNTDMRNDQTLDYILTHEYIHIKRFDIVLKWVSAIAVCINWFNPLVWVMYALINRDIELSCDEGVIKSKGLESKKSYAMALVDMEATKRSYNPLVNSFNKNSIKERVTAIMKNKKLGVIGIVVAFTLIISAVVVLVSSCTTVRGEGYETEQSDTTETQPQTDEVPEETATADEKHPNVRYGDTKDTVLLDIEWYTYEGYLAFMEDFKINYQLARDSYVKTEAYLNLNEEGKMKSDEDAREYIESRMGYAEQIKTQEIYVPCRINGKPAEDTGFHFQFKNPYNNLPEDTTGVERNVDGYFIYHLYPVTTTIWYNDVTSGLFIKKFSKEWVNSSEEYTDILKNEVKPFFDKEFENGKITKEHYEQLIGFNTVDELINGFFG